jgi:hypothetical protein
MVEADATEDTMASQDKLKKFNANQAGWQISKSKDT